MKVRIRLKMNVILDARAIATGFSESFYCEKSTLAAALELAEGIAKKRAKLLPTDGRMFDVTVSDYDKPGIALSSTTLFFGNSEVSTDTPWQCVLLDGANGSGSRRNIYVHSVPDIQFTNGSYQPTSTYDGHMKQYMNFLSNSGLQWKGVDSTQPIKKLGQVTAGSNNTAVVKYFFGGAPYDLNDKVTAWHSKDQFGQSIKGTMEVVDVDLANATISLAPYYYQNAPGIRLRKVATAWKTIDVVSVDRVIIKKTGAPFGAPVGRRPSR